MQKEKEDHFEILRKINKKPDASQRELAEDLGFSLGKLNYCLKALQKKGLIKLENFKKKTNDSYALAKIGGIKYCEGLRQQYGFDAIVLMPTNLYGTCNNPKRNSRKNKTYN